LTLIAGFSTLDKKTNNDSMYLGLSVDMNATGLGIKSNNIYEFNFKYTFKGWKSYCDWSPHAPKARSHEILKCANFY
ncbi:MAG TPA: hypothetical protein VK590_07760, partial [Saprospiraceae bacterium]|nr:hypothetical protein [Saprospiraceae bacterium]